MHEMDLNPLWEEEKAVTQILLENTLDGISIVMMPGNTVLFLFF